MAKVTGLLPPADIPKQFGELTKGWQLYSGLTIRFNTGAPPAWLEHTQDFITAASSARAAWRVLRPWKKTAWSACAKKRSLNGWALYLQQYLLQRPAAGKQPISPCSAHATITENSQWDAGASVWDGSVSAWDGTLHNFSPYVAQPPAASTAKRVALAAEAADCTELQAQGYLDQYLHALVAALKKGMRVTITNIGTFYTAKTAARTYRSKKTGLLQRSTPLNLVRMIKAPWLLALVDTAHSAKIVSPKPETRLQKEFAGFVQQPRLLDDTTAERLVKAYWYLVAQEIAAGPGRVEVPQLGSIWQYQAKQRLRRMPNYKNYDNQYTTRIGWRQCKALRKALN